MRSKSKSKTTMNHQNEQTVIGTTSPVAPVALLVDGENVTAPDLIPQILVEAGKLGEVVVRQVYGNWATPYMQAWKKNLVRYALEPKGTLLSKPGRNATDIALVIGAMDLLYRGIKYFCIVAGDSDYVPLVLRLRQESCTVLMIGTASMSVALKEASSTFLSTEQFIPPTSSCPSIPTHSSVFLPPQTTQLTVLLTEAYCSAKQDCETDWVLLSTLGTALRQLNPNFQVISGKQRLSTLIKQYPTLFEIQHRKSGNGQVGEVRLRVTHL